MSTYAPTKRTPRLPGVGRAVVAVLALGLALVIGISAASAYWGSSGSTWVSTKTGTLAAPTDVVGLETATAEVSLTWNRGTGGIDPADYVVTRSDGRTINGECTSSATSLIVSTSCTDTAVPDGTFSYVVTAVFRSWTASSVPSAPVTVSNAATLAFTTQVTDTTADTTLEPAIRVSVLTADGDPFLVAGISVTLELADNPTGGTLVGLVTVNTDASGTATFSSVSIAQPGTGYTLTATSPNLTSATSAPFDVVEPPVLGVAQPYSVFAATAIVNTGETTISGDLGVSPGITVTGLEPSAIGGDIHVSDASAATARAAVTDAYAELAALTSDDELATNLAGLILTPGIYHSTAALALTGTLTLDAQGDANATFVFQTDAAFNTAASSTVVLTGGAVASNVYWVVKGASGIGASSSLSGTILSLGAITLGAGAELIGRALSFDNVTLAGNTIRFTDTRPPAITIDGAATVATRDTAPTIAGTTSAPESSAVTVVIADQTLRTAVRADGTWEVTASMLPAGVYEILAKVRDAAGNGSTASQSLTVEVNPPQIHLNAAGTYSVLAGTSVVNTGETTISGDLGVSPGTSVTGLPAGAPDGNIYAGDANAIEAQNDLTRALADGTARTPHTEIAGDLGGQTFHIGVHHTTAALSLTGTVTLDGQGDAGAVFIFQTDAAFNTAAGSTILLINGAQPANVFWIVTGAAGTGADSSLVGAVLARGAITLGARTELIGQALSRDNVTLASSTLGGITPSPSGVQMLNAETNDSPAPVEEPSTSPADVHTLESEPAKSETPQPTPSAVETDGAVSP